MGDTLNEMLAEAVKEMTRLSGGMAVCTFTKSGTPVPGIKYAEGRWASLRELERSMSGGTVPVEAVSTLLDVWRDKLESLQARGANKDWTAYAHGGVDALTEYSESIT